MKLNKEANLAEASMQKVRKETELLQKQSENAGQLAKLRANNLKIQQHIMHLQENKIEQGLGTSTVEGIDSKFELCLDLW